MKRIGILVSALLVVLAGAALGAAVKRDLVPQMPADDPDAMASGQVVPNHAAGEDKTIVQRNAEGLTPGMTYRPLIPGHGWLDPVVAGPNGKIQVHAVAEGDVSDRDTFVLRSENNLYFLILRTVDQTDAAPGGRGRFVRTRTGVGARVRRAQGGGTLEDSALRPAVGRGQPTDGRSWVRPK